MEDSGLSSILPKTGVDSFLLGVKLPKMPAKLAKQRNPWYTIAAKHMRECSSAGCRCLRLAEMPSKI